jgi:hypothetical protein
MKRQIHCTLVEGVLYLDYDGGDIVALHFYNGSDYSSVKVKYADIKHAVSLLSDDKYREILSRHRDIV